MTLSREPRDSARLTRASARKSVAKALEASGHPDEAQRLWSAVLQMAEGYGDRATAATARTQLQAKP